VSEAENQKKKKEVAGRECKKKKSGEWSKTSRVEELDEDLEWGGDLGGSSPPLSSGWLSGIDVDSFSSAIW
jgi:hypothetical protein